MRRCVIGPRTRKTVRFAEELEEREESKPVSVDQWDTPIPDRGRGVSGETAPVHEDNLAKLRMMCVVPKSSRT
eukprot:4913887-Amphidinium_carterae.1